MNSDEARAADFSGGVIAEETAGEAWEAGDMYMSPCFALFQLSATGEVLGLVNWDYRD